jgi:hypothetical protein
VKDRVKQMVKVKVQIKDRAIIAVKDKVKITMRVKVTDS